MIKDDMTQHKYRIRFLDGDVERIKYADDRRYFERLIAKHGHLDGLSIEPLVLTASQQSRLDEIQGAGLDSSEASAYVQYGTTEEEGAYFDAAKHQRCQQAQVEPGIKAQRKRAEAAGVTVSGISHTGDPGNRQAMQESLAAAADDERAVFATWKDSDGGYHQDVPVADVEAALRKIGNRRGALIELESQYVAQVAAGEADIMALDWSTQHD